MNIIFSTRGEVSWPIYNDNRPPMLIWILKPSILLFELSRFGLKMSYGVEQHRLISHKKENSVLELAGAGRYLSRLAKW